MKQAKPTSKTFAGLKLPRIQVLRFIAAMTVVLFHSLGTGSKYFAGSSRLDVFRFGDLGVDMFFVISGFIIFLTVSSREGTWWLFLRRRLGRIVPMYWLMTLVMAAMLLVPGPSRTPPPDLVYLVESLLYVAWIGDRMPVVYPGWSLEFEMFYYLMVTAALALSPKRWMYVVVAMAALSALGAVAQIAGIHGTAISFFSDPMQLEFAFGIVAAQFILQRKLMVGPLLAIAASLALLTIDSSSERLWRIYAAGLPSVALVAWCASADMRAPLQDAANNWLVKLGDASYSIYLTHVFVISIMGKILQKLWGTMPVDLAILIMALVTLAAAYAMHLIVERPIMRWMKQRGSGQKEKRTRIPLGEATDGTSGESQAEVLPGA